MRDVLEGLNQDQIAAATHTKGSLLVTGGAGCGKTKTLAHRVAWILERKKAAPDEVLVLNNSRHVNADLREKIASLVGEAPAGRILFQTFHELALQVIHASPEACGLTPDFSIYDDAEQTALIEEACAALEIPARFRPRSIMHRVIWAKARMIPPARYLASAPHGTEEVNEFHKAVDQVYSWYNDRLRLFRAADYEDVLNAAALGLETDSGLARRVFKKVKFVILDEYQDVTTAHYALLRRISGRGVLVTAAGDDDQCLVEGSSVLTKSGRLNIEGLREGQEVVSAAGWGAVAVGKVDKVTSRPYDGKIVRIALERGKVIRVTPNHLLFAKFDVHARLSYVFLQKRDGMGYRVGVSLGLSFFLEPRKFDSVEGDRFWILSVHDETAEAEFQLSVTSSQYGLPTLPFTPQGAGGLSQKRIKEFYARVDSASRAELLMEDLGIFEEHPHYISVARTRTEQNPRVLTVTMFGHRDREKGEPWHPHRISINTQKISVAHVGRAKRSEWLVNASRRDYTEIMHFARTLAGIDHLHIVERARLNARGSFFKIPAGHVRRHFFLPVLVDGKVEEYRVLDVALEDYQGVVYDLSVADLHNFVVSDIIVHNSINAWKGSEVRPLLNFTRDYKGGAEIRLERNYRSTKRIAWGAQELVRNNLNRVEKRVWTDNPEGEKVLAYKALNEQDEIYYAINQMRQIVFREEKQYRHFAFLFRAYAQAEILIDVLRKEAIPFRLSGGETLLDRKEVRDIVSYLKALTNRADDLSLLRILNVPRRGIGDKSIHCLVQHARAVGRPIRDCLALVSEIDGLPLKSKNTILNFKDLMDDLAEDLPKFGVAEYLREVIDRTGYFEEMKYQSGTPASERSRFVNLFVERAAAYEKARPGATVRDYLEESLLLDRGRPDDAVENSVFLAPIHGTKNFECPVVFILGLEEGVFPIDRPSLDYFDVEEERRLLYQAMTRARERVFLISAKMRRIFGSVFENCPSRFLKEIPEELVIQLDSEIAQQEHLPQNIKPRSALRAPRADSDYGIVFAPGDRVKHSMWGIGQVVDTAGEGDSLLVTVDFTNAGIKKLLIKYAPLERI